MSRVPNGDFVDDLDDHDPLTQHPGTETAVCLMFMSRRGCVQNSTHLVIYNAKKRAILCAVIARTGSTHERETVVLGWRVRKASD